MSTTTYGVSDLNNIVRNYTSGPTNGSESGTFLNAFFNGSESFILAGSTTGDIANTDVTLQITADVDHGSPPNAVPPTARILQVLIRQKLEAGGNAAIVASAATYGGGSSGIQVDLQASLLVAGDMADIWGVLTVASFIETQSGIAFEPPSQSVSVGMFDNAFATDAWDFTTNPNGDFPFFYCDYATFIAHFATIFIQATALGQATAASPPHPPAGANISGPVGAGIDITTSLWEMVVTWAEFFWWYNATTNHFQYSPTDPGADWTIADPTPGDPVPDITSVGIYYEYEDNVPVDDSVASPAFGCIGTPIIIDGSGFGDGAIVTVDNVTADNIVVIDQTRIYCEAPTHANGGPFDVKVTNPDAQFDILAASFTYLTPWWAQVWFYVVDGVVTEVVTGYVQQCDPPVAGLWRASSTAPAYLTHPQGWYVSPSAYAGDVGVIAGAIPADPREWTKISTWATGERAMLGGSPLASATLRNRLVYPGNSYTPGTDYPPLRVFDGIFDRELARLPSTAAAAIPRAAMSFIAANQLIYFTSHDAGTGSGDWSGRVFSFDITSGKMTQLGSAFSGGDLPYALCWHMGRLWVGTNNGIGTLGKVYYLRPDIDADWTLDHTLTTDSVGGVDSMCSFNGKLYIGSDGAGATFAKVLERDSAGAYTTSLTATGGVAKVNNGFLAMRVFGTAMYATYWNNDATAITKIYKFTGSAWSTVFNGAAGTLRPLIALFVDEGKLFAIGGGFALTGIILTSPDGSAWTNQTGNLPETNKTLLPILGVEVF